MRKSRKTRKQKQKQSSSNISPLSSLRPRLDRLLQDEELTQRDTPTVKADLDAVCQGIKAADFLPVLLRAYHSAPQQVRIFLNATLAQWLNERGYANTLVDLLENHRINEKMQQVAHDWLKAAGCDVMELQEASSQSPFFEAYTFSDDSQGVILLFWYEDNRRRKVEGLCFLLDYNPPWEGAVKDVAVYEATRPEQALQRYVGFWKERMSLEALDAAEVKQEIIRHLLINRRENIRLPRDLIVSRRTFLENVLSLPDTDRAPVFTAKDFDDLSRTGKSVEEIRRYEQTVGHRVRMENGKEMLVIGDPLGDDEW